ncbi:LuxR C-terminal-related transcriptional regulator [Microvirga soli]|jgi:two-component system nitrate/nitrite response regulator NarL|uniref:LuxR C-terminal-related transcriptional regulator n=1 Tax=Microvirga soli TaxID=1854496 RepID=UPI00191DA38F|nr:response regulator transcription factor [Microvirga soli]
MSDDAAKERNEYVTVLICKNSLLREGLKHLLADTCFAVSDTVTDEPPPWRPRLYTQAALFIADASNSSARLIEIVRLLKERQGEARIVFVAHDFELGFIRLGLAAGVDGFCLAGSDREVLIKSLELVMMGEKLVPGALVHSLVSEMASNVEPDQDEPMAEALPIDPKMHKLSKREVEILTCLMRGEPNKVIAKKLDVAEATIKVHVKAILRKIGAANRTQAAMWATEHMPRKRDP